MTDHVDGGRLRDAGVHADLPIAHGEGAPEGAAAEMKQAAVHDQIAVGGDQTSRPASRKSRFATAVPASTATTPLLVQGAHQNQCS